MVHHTDQIQSLENDAQVCKRRQELSLRHFQRAIRSRVDMNAIEFPLNKGEKYLWSRQNHRQWLSVQSEPIGPASGGTQDITLAPLREKRVANKCSCSPKKRSPPTYSSPS
jgi:hypothetical protein